MVRFVTISLHQDGMGSLGREAVSEPDRIEAWMVVRRSDHGSVPFSAFRDPAVPQSPSSPGRDPQSGFRRDSDQRRHVPAAIRSSGNPGHGSPRSGLRA
jgi:hypothetical protein